MKIIRSLSFAIHQSSTKHSKTGKVNLEDDRTRIRAAAPASNHSIGTTTEEIRRILVATVDKMIGYLHTELYINQT